MAQYILNNIVRTMIRMSPNMALVGYNIPFPGKFMANVDSKVCDTYKPRQRAESLIQTQNLATECHKRALEDIKRFAGRYRRDAPVLKEGDQVFLSQSTSALDSHPRRSITYGMDRSKSAKQ